jgi:hypothetical protein
MTICGLLLAWHQGCNIAMRHSKLLAVRTGHGAAVNHFNLGSDDRDPPGGVMKSKIYGALVMLAVALIVGVPFVQAQSRVQADVPFAFRLNDKAMPAGNYQIIALDDQVLEAWNLDARRGQLLLKQISVQSSQPKSPRLVFHKYGEQYFLSEIWYGDSRYGIALAESKLEKEVKMARDGPPNAPETVIVAMK